MDPATSSPTLFALAITGLLALASFHAIADASVTTRQVAVPTAASHCFPVAYALVDTASALAQRSGEAFDRHRQRVPLHDDRRSDEYGGAALLPPSGIAIAPSQYLSFAPNQRAPGTGGQPPRLNPEAEKSLDQIGAGLRFVF